MGVVPLAIHARNALAARCASLALFTFSRRPNTLGRGAVGLPQHTLANERGSLRRRADKYAVATQDVNWRVYRKINYVQTNVRPR